MKKVKRWLVAIVLLPACYGVFQGLWVTLHPFRDVPEGSYCFFAGMLSYVVFQWAFFRPIRTYVFGHELTHALASWMIGGNVTQFKVGKHGGSVTVNKSNFFVALSPYMIPLYSLLLAAAFFTANHFYPLRPYWPLFLWLLGVSMGFHAALTAFALRQRQPDLKPTGRLLSGVVIFLGNALSLVFVMGVAFPRTVSWNHFARTSGRHTLSAWREIGHGGYALYQGTVHELIRRS